MTTNIFIVRRADPQATDLASIHARYPEVDEADYVIVVGHAPDSLTKVIKSDGDVEVTVL